jgi:hypothetical protein
MNKSNSKVINATPNYVLMNKKVNQIIGNIKSNMQIYSKKMKETTDKSRKTCLTIEIGNKVLIKI